MAIRGPTIGGVLGGGSSINFMMYSRGAASDYDDWDTPGWGSKDLMPLLQKIETYHITPGRETHGYEGPVNVSYGDYFAQVANEYLDVCVSRGIPMVDDIMDLHTGHGCARLAKYINPNTGRREDAAHRYIHSQSHNRRLHVLTKTLVTRVLFDKNKAIGVEVIGNKNQDPGAEQTPRRIIARKLVVVSAGAIGSPIVLQRSGVGEASRLSKLGIDVVVNLPGVGANYEDHSSCIIPYHVPDDVETIDPVMEQDKAVIETYLAQFANGKGFLTTNLNDAGSRLRPTSDELKEIGPAFNELWKRHFEPAPDKAVFVQTILNGFIGPRSVVPKGSRFMMVANILAYPASSGHVYITSTDPYSPPDFHAGFLEDQADLEAHVWMYKKSREIFRRIPSYRGEYAPLHPRFPSGSRAGCVRTEKALAQGIEDLVYTEEDNAALEDWVRERSDTTWHSVGTVQMKSKENGGCVDSRLNVYGTLNLKVVDLSVLPSNVGANTYSTALLVGEKAALIIAEDLGVNTP
ncbi:unnamed protein product [Rhizoctonia solani]|uniref:Glucose-methanol-choline oxidoreductase N-terminal domain-containing protein n=1 Tax=Rhizoctonia solani TaxID=456999 RepID=A0A8H3BM89_9AGAM|nr:unnamed protein product [Rhizoctonia solani]